MPKSYSIDYYQGVEPEDKKGYTNCQRCFEYTFCHKHHLLLRSQGGGDDVLVNVCPRCHNEIHQHPKRAEAEGFYIRRHSADGKRKNSVDRVKKGN